MAATAQGTVSSSASWMPRGLRRAAPRLIARGEPPRHLGQQHGADRDADHADGKLVDAVGVIERGERAGRQERGDQRVGEKRKLHAAAPMIAGPERLEEAARRLVELSAAQADADPVRLGVAADQQHLATPAISTPHAAAWPAVGKNGASSSVAIIDRLSRIGAPAAAAKRLLALRTPANSVSIDTSADRER